MYEKSCWVITEDNPKSFIMKCMTCKFTVISSKDPSVERMEGSSSSGVPLCAVKTKTVTSEVKTWSLDGE